MMYLKWMLLLVCVGLTLWPLLAGRPGHGGKEGERS
jgi:hypothetical protein